MHVQLATPPLWTNDNSGKCLSAKMLSLNLNVYKQNGCSESRTASVCLGSYTVQKFDETVSAKELT